MANKQDLKDAMTVKEMSDVLALHSIKRHDWHIQVLPPIFMMQRGAKSYTIAIHRQSFKLSQSWRTLQLAMPSDHRQTSFGVQYDAGPRCCHLLHLQDALNVVCQLMSGVFGLGAGHVCKDWRGAHGRHGVDRAEGEGGSGSDNPPGVASAQPCKAPRSADASLTAAAAFSCICMWPWLAEDSCAARNMCPLYAREGLHIVL